MRDPQKVEHRLAVLSRVRCLDCGLAYVKPTKGGTVEQNPGCPRCGYIGWIPANVDFTPGVESSHSVADLLQHRVARRH